MNKSKLPADRRCPTLKKFPKEKLDIISHNQIQISAPHPHSPLGTENRPPDDEQARYELHDWDQNVPGQQAGSIIRIKTDQSLFTARMSDTVFIPSCRRDVKRVREDQPAPPGAFQLLCAYVQGCNRGVSSLGERE